MSQYLRNWGKERELVSVSLLQFAVLAHEVLLLAQEDCNIIFLLLQVFSWSFL